MPESLFKPTLADMHRLLDEAEAEIERLRREKAAVEQEFMAFSDKIALSRKQFRPPATSPRCDHVPCTREPGHERRTAP